MGAVIADDLGFHPGDKIKPARGILQIPAAPCTGIARAEGRAAILDAEGAHERAVIAFQIVDAVQLEPALAFKSCGVQ